jgi:hypothetical protein
MNKNKVANNRLYMKYYNTIHLRGFPDYNSNKEYKEDYMEINKDLIEDYKNNKEYYFHQKRRGRPPNWKKDIDAEEGCLSKKTGNFKISFD